jgi:predicted dehydrogenase
MHAAALAAAPGAELVAVWGRDPAKAADLAGRHGARAYSDVDALLADVDAVAIALPPDVQAPLAAHAARAGRHLFLDKPLALDVAAADEVVAAVNQAGVASVVFFTKRFTAPAAEFLRGAAGRDWDGGRATILASLAGGSYEVSPWRQRHGGLWDVGPHALSVLLPVLGPVTDVAAAAGPHRTTTVLLCHAGGAVSTMTLSVHAPPAAATWEVTFHGADGWASVPAGGAALDACVAAIGEVVAARTDHPCGVAFARDVVAVLASADAAAGQR